MSVFYTWVSVASCVFMVLAIMRLYKPKKDVFDHVEQCLYIYLYIVLKVIEITGEFGNVWLKGACVFVWTLWLCAESFALGAISNEERKEDDECS